MHPIEKRERWILLALAGLQFTHILDFMIIMPLGPVFLRDFSIDAQHFGWLVSCYTFSAAVATLLAAVVIDRFPRRPCLLVLYAAFTVATLLCALAPGYVSLLVARCAAGAFGGLLGAMTFTLIGDLIPEQRRGRATGIVMASFSIATVAGVPLSLLIAHHSSWRVAFIFIAFLCVFFFIVAWRFLPATTAHARPQGQVWWLPVRQVLQDPNHWHAFVFITLVMFGGFSVIPFITLYLTSNTGLSEAHLPWVYLVGGLCTFFTTRWFGRLADQLGKATLFRALAAISLAPLLALTHWPATSAMLTLVVTTAFFVFISGRMVPGMALVTSSANPVLRGTFMSLNSAVQQFASGLASLLAGMLIVRSPSGQVLHYGTVGWVAAAMTMLAILMASKIQIRG